ncbi:MAG: amino acid--[acyl-carrier-protein] ligase [Gluconacetobacter diazotrophicus]|nr:amino acid--[acyl-carrier-protein] ligase [Gluconacetobacter diazotrophicus]
MPGRGRFLSALVAAGHLLPTAVQGLYGRGAEFARLVDILGDTLRRHFGRGAERQRFASVMPRLDLERIGYFRNFPHLLGTVHCFCGDEPRHRTLLARHDAGEDWTTDQAASDLVLIPAACYPVYPLLAARGSVPDAGWLVNVEANCFRREPSEDPARMQSFHMQELVRVAAPDVVLRFRDDWLARGLQLFADWKLPAEASAADDPFFGRAAAVMARGQRDKALKFEITVPIGDADAPTACMSANCHLDSFGRALGLRFADGATAHSACVGFGLERVALALLHHHGLDLSRWPGEVRRRIGIG